MTTSERAGLKAWRWLLLSALIVALDQWSKAWASAALASVGSIQVFPGLRWTLAHNPGVAFSMLSDGADWQRALLSVFALSVATMFAWMLTRTARHERGTRLAFALVIGGAIGNVIDRLRFGYVIDFIDVYWNRSHWPAFNVADSSICVGALVLLFWGWRHSGAAARARDAEQAR